MSTKLKVKFNLVLAQNKKLKNERQRLMRTLAAIIHHQGPITIPFSAACEVEESDQVEVLFDKKDGSYIIALRGVDNAEPMGSGSSAIGVSGGEGDVDGLVPEGKSDGPSEEVREGNQHHPRSLVIVRTPDPE